MSERNAKVGRPRVDSEQLRARADRTLLNALDEFIADEPEPIAKGEATRRILLTWLVERGYIASDDLNVRRLVEKALKT